MAKNRGGLPHSSYAMGAEDAQSDFNNVGTDYALELADRARIAIEEGISPKIAVRREIAGFRKRHGKDWYQEAMNRAFSEESDGEAVRSYAHGYVTRYFDLIEEHVVHDIKVFLRERSIPTEGQRQRSRFGFRPPKRLRAPDDRPTQGPQRLFSVDTFGRRQLVKSLEDARDRWIQHRDSSGEGVSDIGNGVHVETEDGRVIGRVSYNGRIWLPGEGSGQ